jgi:hypothetical protein
MNIVFYCIAGVVVVIALLIWCMLQMHYRIGSKYLKIVLFGLTIRRIRLDQIGYISKRTPKGIAEYWHNCFKSNHRVLTIERTRGLRKYVSITPRNRYIFLADLKSAIRRVNPQADWADTIGLEDAPGAIDTTGESYRREADQKHHQGDVSADQPG